MKRAWLALALSLSVIGTSTEARDPRAVREFKREVQCPATGKRRGACLGYVVDHVVPLCNAGADKPSNMQWQSIADAKVKDRDELRQCREAKRAKKDF